MKGCLITLAVIIGGLVVIGLILSSGSSGSTAAGRDASNANAIPRAAQPADQVTLEAWSGNIVQMFERVGPGDEGKTTQFPNGTQCTKVSGPTPVSIEGIAMSFYKLTCNGVTGYVNVKWVR